jgi:PAS domain S-box-containing protein
MQLRRKDALGAFKVSSQLPKKAGGRCPEGGAAVSMKANDFQFLAENSADMICRAGMDRVVRYISPSCLNLLGYAREEMEGRTFDRHIFPEDLPGVMGAMERALAPGVVAESQTGRMVRKDHSLLWIEANARVIRDEVTGEAQELVLVMRDVTERKLVEEKLAMLARTDGLTGIANRRAFDEALEREWKRTLRHGTQISLLLLDIDHFKEFNDAYGHQVGDDCLRAVAQATANGLRGMAGKSLR